MSLNHGRVPWPAPAELTSAGLEVHEAITGGPRAGGARLFRMADDDGRLEGPFNAMVLAPSIGLPLQEVGAAIRYRTSLGDRCREVAILASAAYRRSDYEAYAHEAVAGTLGFTPDEIAQLREGSCPPTLSADERIVHDTSLRLLEHRRLTTSEFAQATGVLGVTGLLELVTLIGYYDTLDLLMNAVDSPLPSGVQSPFSATGGSDDSTG